MQWLTTRVGVPQTRTGDERQAEEARQNPVREPADGRRMPEAHLSSWLGVAQAGRAAAGDPAPDGRRPLRLRHVDRI